MNCKRACLLIEGQLELVADQLDHGAQVVVFVALLLEGVLHLAELLLLATALHYLWPKLDIKACPSHISTMSKRLTTDSREKDNKGNRRLTVHVCPKPAHLITLLGHLGLQVSYLFLALTDLHGEPGGHTLSCNL